ncbi:hypothetical protein PCC6912_50660 [Chlorogloeopsis fritschii PCC 6912]|uniref:Uncharacterized protein n=1 Tax=Chlorogloeopsis fritschii PCC 6912 TaxID=211165 RepID=A0A433N1K0_CHLFR|nr:hypothetical protein [Chlorogloeopsis fritschii]RUR74888.1 hypothetical protein PCC6912_50660 [Chlorogloeopsis fritschii PCC 6912]
MGTTLDYVLQLKEVYQKVADLEKSLPNNLGYILNSVLGSYENLFNRFCPFKVGERVVLTKTPEIDKESGWYRGKHFLVEGAIATIKNRDYYQNKFVFYLEFENESWIDSNGEIHLYDPERRHHFAFSEDFVGNCLNVNNDI